MTTNTPVAPERSLVQRMAALERANVIRTKRADLKRDLANPRVAVDVAALLLDPPEWLTSMKLSDLIVALPGYGVVKRNKVLIACRISHSKTIGGLSVRQRTEVLTFLAPAHQTPRVRAAMLGTGRPYGNSRPR